MKYSKIIFAAILLSYGHISADQQIDVVRDAFVVTISKGFSGQRNLFEDGVNEQHSKELYFVLKNTRDRIQEAVAKKRTIPISKANQDLFNKALGIIDAAARALIDTINKARAANFNFAKDKYAQVNVAAFRDLVVTLQPKIDQLEKIRKDLEPIKSVIPGKSDIEDTVAIKKLLQDEANIVQGYLERLQTHWQQLQNKIVVSVKLEEQKARDQRIKGSTGGPK